MDSEDDDKEVGSNEADVSTEQSLEKEDARFPCTHEDEGRPPCAAEKAPARQKEAFGIRRARSLRWPFPVFMRRWPLILRWIRRV